FIGEINQTFTERSLEEQHESGFYDFTDGSRIYSLSLDGELPGINTDDTFIGIIEYSEKAAEGATSTEGFENFEETLEDLMRFFGVTETEIPEKLDITADCGYEEGTTVFTGYIISYGEGFLNGDTPEFFCINIKPGEAIYGEAVMSLKIPAYFAGRLNPDKEYLFVCHENELTEPAGLLEINNDGTLSSPLGLNYYGGEFGLKSKDDYRIYYGINHIAAKRIRDTFIGLGNFSKDTEEFDLVYTPVDVYSGVADTNSEIRITYKDGKLTLQIYNKDRGSVYYFRDSESGNLYRLDENDDKIFTDSSEYLDRSMLISYIISVKALESTSGFLKNDSDIVYETPAGNKLTLGMEEGKLKTLSLNGSLLANIGYITFY
ncbi:MAG: hypothetical protein PHW77_02850, partial [Eubacteriales bacterium]|nr:hypothetical protein [Eubacteriales bacterium]